MYYRTVVSIEKVSKEMFYAPHHRFRPFGRSPSTYDGTVYGNRMERTPCKRLELHINQVPSSREILRARVNPAQAKRPVQSVQNPLC